MPPRGPLLFLAILAVSTPAHGGVQTPGTTGTIEGAVSRQQGDVALTGAAVVVTDARARVVARRTSDGDGRFSVAGLAPGTYTVRAALSGFTTTSVWVAVIPGETADVPLHLAVAAEAVTVVSSSEVLTAGDALAPREAMASRELEQFLPGTGFLSAVRQFASVMATPNGVSIKGGRPDQAGVQLGVMTLVDPASAITHLPLPDDAMQAVTVLPNPYDVAYGRFSAGIVTIESRRASDQWRFQVSRTTPIIRNRRGELFSFRLDDFRPRFAAGGPLVRGRLFLEQTGQVRYAAADVPSRPEDELRILRSFSSFSRVDAILSPRHSAVVTLGLFPSETSSATLGTFTPPDAAADVDTFTAHAAVTERVRWTDETVTETTIHVLRARTDVLPHGLAPMQLLPETTVGNFFNQQHRQSTTVQLAETITAPRSGPWGRHLFKLGFDVLASTYDGSSDSRLVLIERSDGTLARRLDYAGPSRQVATNTDTGLFAQDRIELTGRWSLDVGGRVDRDGLVDRVNVSPRIGTAVKVTASGRAVLRGGVGLFHGRTPSTVGAFESFTSAVDTRFAGDGMTPLAAPLLQTPVKMADLETPHSRAWDVGVDFRVNPEWTLHTNLIARDGRGEFIVVPALAGSLRELQLSSDGRSSYRDLELGVRYTRGTTLDVEALYDWSTARGDLNVLTGLFDTVMAPVVSANAYAPLSMDVPHRLFVRGRALAAPRWLLVGVVDWRTGVPYSIHDVMLDFVGPRNDRRFPNYARLELGIEHRLDLFRWKPWVGVRATNVFDAFLPSDVQANISSPLFGRFYNSEDRHIRLQLRFGS